MVVDAELCIENEYNTVVSPLWGNHCFLKPLPITPFTNPITVFYFNSKFKLEMTLEI